MNHISGPWIPNIHALKIGCSGQKIATNTEEKWHKRSGKKGQPKGKLWKMFHVQQIVNIFQWWIKKNAAGEKKIISQRQQFTFYSLCVEDTCRGFIYSPVSVRFFFQLSSFSCDFLFVRFLLRPRSDFRLLLINCYFYDFMLTRKRDIIVINVQSSWISCSSMKFLSISRFYDFWCMRYERLPLTSSFLFFLCLLFSVCVVTGVEAVIVVVWFFSGRHFRAIIKCL